jgi:membrane protease YdiL (CAAX protease family)
MGYT